jgi:hypothetical protein
MHVLRGQTAIAQVDVSPVQDELLPLLLLPMLLWMLLLHAHQKSLVAVVRRSSSLSRVRLKCGASQQGQRVATGQKMALRHIVAKHDRRPSQHRYWEKRVLLGNWTGVASAHKSLFRMNCSILSVSASACATRGIVRYGGIHATNSNGGPHVSVTRGPQQFRFATQNAMQNQSFAVG